MGGGGPKAPLTIPPQTTLGSAANPLSTWRSQFGTVGDPTSTALLQVIAMLAAGQSPTPNQYPTTPLRPAPPASSPQPGGVLPGRGGGANG
jgi:hypothetical protein